MPINRWDTPIAKDSDDSKMETFDEVEEQMKKNNNVKTSAKRKREEKKLEALEATHKKRLEWVQKKAKDTVIPTEEGAVLKPSYFFKDLGPYVINMCSSCRVFNGDQEVKQVKDGMVQIPMALCTVCRAHLNHQRTTKFFHFDLPNMKKAYNL